MESFCYRRIGLKCRIY